MPRVNQDETKRVRLFVTRPRGVLRFLYALLDEFFEHEIIDGHGRRAYLHRWVLRSWQDGRALYLHHFVGSDWSRDLHDHPKPFVSIGLVGGYDEERLVFEESTAYDIGRVTHSKLVQCSEHKRYRAPFIRSFSATHAHRLKLIDPGSRSWTLVFVGRREREWGFYTIDGWVPWHEYVRSPAADVGFEPDSDA